MTEPLLVTGKILKTDLRYAIQVKDIIGYFAPPKMATRVINTLNGIDKISPGALEPFSYKYRGISYLGEVPLFLIPPKTDRPYEYYFSFLGKETQKILLHMVESMGLSGAKGCGDLKFNPKNVNFQRERIVLRILEENRIKAQTALKAGQWDDILNASSKNLAEEAAAKIAEKRRANAEQRRLFTEAGNALVRAAATSDDPVVADFFERLGDLLSDEESSEAVGRLLVRHDLKRQTALDGLNGQKG